MKNGAFLFLMVLGGLANSSGAFAKLTDVDVCVKKLTSFGVELYDADYLCEGKMIEATKLKNFSGCMKVNAQLSKEKYSAARKCDTPSKVEASTHVGYTKCLKNVRLVDKESLFVLCESVENVEIISNEGFLDCVNNQKKFGNDAWTAMDRCGSKENITYYNKSEYGTCIQAFKAGGADLISAEVLCNRPGFVETAQDPQLPTCLSNITWHTNNSIESAMSCILKTQRDATKHSLFESCIAIAIELGVPAKNAFESCRNPIAITNVVQPEVRPCVKILKANSIPPKEAIYECTHSNVVKISTHNQFGECLKKVQSLGVRPENSVDICNQPYSIERVLSSKFETCVAQEKITLSENIHSALFRCSVLKYSESSNEARKETEEFDREVPLEEIKPDFLGPIFVNPIINDAKSSAK